MASDAILFELGVRQSALRIPFEGMAQRDAIRTIYKFAPPSCEYNLCEAGELFFHRETPL
jgi:hypothetical protein